MASPTRLPNTAAAAAGRIRACVSKRDDVRDTGEVDKGLIQINRAQCRPLDSADRTALRANTDCDRPTVSELLAIGPGLKTPVYGWNVVDSQDLSAFQQRCRISEGIFQILKYLEDGTSSHLHEDCIADLYGGASLIKPMCRLICLSFR